MAARVPGMPTARAIMSPVSRPPPPLLLLVDPDVDVDVLEVPCAAEEVEVPANDDVKEDDFAAVAVIVMPAAAVLATVVPPVVASPRLQYAAKTDAACVASGRGEVRQEFKMFVEIWSEYS